MAAELKAALRLSLEDHLSGPLNQINRMLAGLRDLGKQLGFPGLDSGIGELNRAVKGTEALSQGLRGIGRAADESGAALRRLGQDSTLALKEAMSTLNIAKLRGAQWETGPTGVRPPTMKERLGQFRETADPLVGAAAGYEIMSGVRDYAEFDAIARQTAIIQGLQGKAADAEIARLTSFARAEALATGNDSLAILKGYHFLMTTRMSREEVDSSMRAHAMAATAYNIDPEVMGQAVYSIRHREQFGIGADDLPKALSMLAYASTTGHFNMANFSQFLPQVGAPSSMLGIKGLKGLATTAAALEVVRGSVGEPGQAATDYADLLQTITAPFTVRRFKEHGIDLPKEMKERTAKGQTTLDAYLDILQEQLKGLTGNDVAFRLGEYTHNQQAGNAARTLIENRPDFEKRRSDMLNISPDTLQKHFEEAFRGPAADVKVLAENIRQLNQDLGKGFIPILEAVNYPFTKLNQGFNWLADNLPSVSGAIDATAASFLGLLAAVGIIGFLSGPMKAGWELLKPILKPLVPIFEALGSIFRFILAPVRLLAAALRFVAAGFVELLIASGPIGWITAGLIALAFAANEIYKHWSGISAFFSRMWGDVQAIWNETWDWMKKWAPRAGAEVLASIRQAFDAISDYFVDMWGNAGKAFDAFMAHVAAELPSLTHMLGLDEKGHVRPDLGLVPGDDTGLPYAPLHKESWRGQIDISIDGPGRVTKATFDSPNVAAPSVSRGQVLGRA